MKVFLQSKPYYRATNTVDSGHRVDLLPRIQLEAQYFILHTEITIKLGALKLRVQLYHRLQRRGSWWLHTFRTALRVDDVAVTER